MGLNKGKRSHKEDARWERQRAKWEGRGPKKRSSDHYEYRVTHSPGEPTKVEGSVGGEITITLTTASGQWDMGTVASKPEYKETQYSIELDGEIFPVWVETGYTMTHDYCVRYQAAQGGYLEQVEVVKILEGADRSIFALFKNKTLNLDYHSNRFFCPQERFKRDHVPDFMQELATI